MLPTSVGKLKELFSQSGSKIHPKPYKVSNGNYRITKRVKYHR